jgi:GNAT superfamily N-acetyltransferase
LAGDNVLTGIVPLHLPRDRHALEAHFAALGSEDLRYRFCGSIKPAALKQYLDQLNGPDSPSFGIFDSELTLIALCQIGQAGGELEVGVSVLPPFRRRGLARALLEYSASHARVRGLRTLLIHTLVDNSPMLSLAREMGMRVEIVNGEADGRLRLRADTVAEGKLGMPSRPSHPLRNQVLPLRDQVRADARDLRLGNTKLALNIADD